MTPALHLGSTAELLLWGESGELPMDERGMGRYLAVLLTTCVGGGRAGPEVLRVEELFLPLTSYSTWESVLSTSPGPLGGAVSELIRAPESGKTSSAPWFLLLRVS